MADVRLNKLLELERRGVIKPEHQAELDGYRRQGLAKPLKPPAAAGSGTAPIDKNTLGQARAKLAAARMLREQLKEVRSLYKTTLGKSNGGIAAIAEYFPTPENRRFNAAADGLMPLARQAFRVPGSGADSDKELEVLVRSLLPRHSDYDAVNEQRMAQLESMIDGTEKEWGPIVGETPRKVTPRITLKR
jgi:hypothetical protein